MRVPALRLPAWLRHRAGWVVGAVVCVAVAVVLVMAGGDRTTPTAASTTIVQRGTVTVAVSAAGTVESSQTLGLSFSVAGTVTELNVRAGDLVSAGQVLARIDPADAQAAVDSAAARVDDAQTALARAEQTAALPACPSPTTAAPTHAAPATTSPAPSGQPTVSPATPTPAATTSRPAQGGGATGGGGAAGGTGATATCTQPGRNPTSDALLSAQQQLNNAQLTLTLAKAKLAGTVITAPIAGRVLSVGGRVGSRASPGGTGFVVLGDVSTLTVAALFTEADVGRLAVGQPATITLPDRTDPVSGKVSVIDPAGTVSNRLVRYRVVIAFDQVPPDLLLGQSATVLVTTAEVDKVLYVASAAVVASGDGAGTVTVRSGGRDEARTVRIGLRGDQYTEIASGLDEGDVVVLRPPA